MNTLIALGAGAAWVWSTVVATRWLAGPQHHMPALYFEAGAAIVAFVMVGKLLEARARARLSEAVRGLLSLVPASAVAAGDTIVVKPGERIPGDGTVVEGTSAVDEAMLTGESLPVDKTEGSPVYAGTLNHHGALTIRVARAGTDTALARIARAVEDAQAQKAPIARLADRVAAVFVPGVLVIAAATFAVWLLVGDASVALERMIAVLVIACPCALGLATPAAVAVGTARGAELGVLFKGGGALETASAISVVCLRVVAHQPCWCLSRRRAIAQVRSPVTSNTAASTAPGRGSQSRSRMTATGPGWCVRRPGERCGRRIWATRLVPAAAWATTSAASLGRLRRRRCAAGR
jgi:Cu+-exporting ATPase